jgi:acyl-ACP thioesterase
MDLTCFEKEYRVHVYETGPNGRISLYSVLDLMQDIASDHAELLGFGREDLIRNNRFWVLSRIYVVITDLPVWEDTIVVRTWHKGVDKLFGMRDFEILRNGEKPVISAASSWLVVDRDSKKIQRLDHELSNNARHVDALPRNAEKLGKIEGDCRLSQPFNVKISDLDVNLHTNNTRYIKWATDTYDLDFTMNHVPVSAEINYLVESVYGDNILIETVSTTGPEKVYDHCILKTGNNTEEKKEICRIRLNWNEYKYVKS